MLCDYLPRLQRVCAVVVSGPSDLIVGRLLIVNVLMTLLSLVAGTLIALVVVALLLIATAMHVYLLSHRREAFLRLALALDIARLPLDRIRSVAVGTISAASISVVLRAVALSTACKSACCFSTKTRLHDNQRSLNAFRVE